MIKFGTKVSNIIEKEFDSEPVSNEKHLRLKINTNFHKNKIPKEGSQCICLSVILIDSFYTKDKDYYPQVFLEECKYVFKEKKASNFINDSIEISSNYFDKEDSAEENSNKEN